MVKPLTQKQNQNQQKQSKKTEIGQKKKCCVKLSLWKLSIFSLILAILGFQIYLRTCPYETLIVASTCEIPKELDGLPLVLPEVCGKREHSLFWHDPTGNYSFKNFAPCADDESRTKCYAKTSSERAAFMSLDYFLSDWKYSDVVTFTPEQEIQKLFKFQLRPSAGILFYDNNLLFQPLMVPSQIKNDKTGTYNFMVPDFKPHSLADVAFNLTLEKLCAQNNSVNLFFQNMNESSKYASSCAKLIEIDVPALCEGLECSLYLNDLLKDSQAKYFGIHFNSLLRALIAYTYGGWTMDPTVLVKETFVPDFEMLFYYDDVAKTAIPTMHFGYFEKNSQFARQYVARFMQFYNKDCYNCLDTALVKNIYSHFESSIEVGSTQFYLPQLESEKIYKLYKAGKFDNEVYNHFASSPFKFWSLRYTDGVHKDVCDPKNLLYSIIAEKISGQKICE